MKKKREFDLKTEFASKAEVLEYVSQTGDEMRAILRKCKACDEEDCATKKRIPFMEFLLETATYMERWVKEEGTVGPEPVT